MAVRSQRPCGHHLLIPPNDAVALAQALRRLISEPNDSGSP
jgi:hypothetical protein